MTVITSIYTELKKIEHGYKSASRKISKSSIKNYLNELSEEKHKHRIDLSSCNPQSVKNYHTDVSNYEKSATKPANILRTCISDEEDLIRVYQISLSTVNLKRREELLIKDQLNDALAALIQLKAIRQSINYQTAYSL